MATRPQHAMTTASGRPAAFGNRVRERIDTTKIVTRLQDHVQGEEEMTATQIQAARILLDRTVPVLRAVEVVSNQQHRDIKDIPTDVFMDILEGQAKRVK